MKIQTQSERGFSFLYTYRVATSNREADTKSATLFGFICIIT